MTRVYIPGNRSLKSAVALFGFLLALLGFSQIVPTLFLLTQNGTELAVISRVTRTQPGFPPETFTSPRRFLEDSHQTVYTYHVQYLHGGISHENALVAASTGKPAYTPGQSLPIIPTRVDGAPVIAATDLRTWVPGGLMAVSGLIIVATFLLIAVRANTPIVIPKDTPDAWGLKFLELPEIGNDVGNPGRKNARE